MTPEEYEKLKKDFLAEFKKADFRKVVEDICKEVIENEGMSWK